MGNSNFTSRSAACHAATMMRSFAWIALIFGLALSGCTTSSVTSLTTSRQPRNASGVYPIEFVWDSNQQTLIESSIKPYVIINHDSYPMRPALDIKNRWETVVPIPADKNYITYKFKVDYLYRSFGKPQKDSRLTASYRLDIVDK